MEYSKSNISKGLTDLESALGKKVVVSNVATNESVIYNNMSDDARQLNVSRKTISRRIDDQKVLNGLYKISYA